jgi:hypothetical protein
VKGTLKDFLAVAQDDNGKSLNGLDFPNPFDFLPSIPFASQRIAWREVQGIQFCRDSPPTTSICWGLCATAGAYHRSHIDCDGFGTFIVPESGTKIWLIAVPKNQAGAALDQQLFEDFAGINLFIEDYDLDEANTHLWNWVAVVLKPGMTLWAFLACNHDNCIDQGLLSAL